MERIEALGKFLSIELEEGETYEDYLSEVSYSENEFESGNTSYLVLTDDEADAKAQEYVRDSLWAFNADFLADETGLPVEVFKALQGQYEDSNEALKTLVESHCDGGIEAFTQSAISSDGRGHFLSQYDGNENEEGEYFIYRTN